MRVERREYDCLRTEGMRVELQAVPDFVAQMKVGGSYTHKVHGVTDSKDYMVRNVEGRDMSASSLPLLRRYAEVQLLAVHAHARRTW